MFNRVVLVPYKMGSKACRALKEGLVAAGVRCYRKGLGSNYKHNPDHLVVYYGGTQVISQEGNALNYTRNIAQNKLMAFRVLSDLDIPTVEWTTDRQQALKWYFDNTPFVVRNTLTGHSGQGIVMFESKPADWEKFEGDVPQAPLYTKYMKKTFECRIHVMNGTVIDGQIKKRKQGAEDVDTHVRNIYTGWVYCREDYTPSDEACSIAIRAVDALELDFGAVDLIYNQHYKQYYVLEVNTAPGLEGTTLANYVQSLKQFMEQ